MADIQDLTLRGEQRDRAAPKGSIFNRSEFDRSSQQVRGLCWHSAVKDFGRGTPAQHLAWPVVEPVFHLAKRTVVNAGQRRAFRKVLALEGHWCSHWYRVAGGWPGTQSKRRHGNAPKSVHAEPFPIPDPTSRSVAHTQVARPALAAAQCGMLRPGGQTVGRRCWRPMNRCPAGAPERCNIIGWIRY
jgi:hypothetical protein